MKPNNPFRELLKKDVLKSGIQLMPFQMKDENNSNEEKISEAYDEDESYNVNDASLSEMISNPGTSKSEKGDSKNITFKMVVKMSYSGSKDINLKIENFGIACYLDM